MITAASLTCARSHVRLDAEPLTGAAAVTLIGTGAILGAAGVLGAGESFAMVGVALGALGLMILLLAGWIDWLTLLVLSLAAPAPYASASIRLAPAAGVTAAVVFAWLLRAALDRREIELRGRPLAATVALFGSVTLSAAVARDPGAAAREVVNWALLLSLLAIATTELRRRPRGVPDLALLLAAAAGVGGFLAALQGLGLLPSAFTWGGTINRATLGFGWPNELGMFMALGIPFAVHATQVVATRRGRVLAWAGVACAAAGLAASFSRGSWVAVSAATLILLFRGRRGFVLRVWLAIALAVLAVELASGGAISARFTSIDGQLAAGQRLVLTLIGTMMFRANPVFGVGPGGFGDALADFGPRVPMLWDYVGSAHNLYVHMAAETGIVGIAALLWLLWTLWRAAFRAFADVPSPTGEASAADREQASLRRALLWSLTTACVVGVFEWSFSHGVGQYIILLGAMALALDRGKGEARP